MTTTDALSRHLQLCDELHQLALEENHFLKTAQRAPDAPLLERRRVLLARLDESLIALRPTNGGDIPSDSALREQRRDTVEKARTRILQILHLQRENEQLVLRHSLGPTRVAAPPPLPPTAAHLQKIYERHG